MIAYADFNSSSADALSSITDWPYLAGIIHQVDQNLSAGNGSFDTPRQVGNGEVHESPPAPRDGEEGRVLNQFFKTQLRHFAPRRQPDFQREYAIAFSIVRQPV